MAHVPRTFLATVTEYGHRVVGGRLALFSTLSHDVAEVNRELDEFFGISNITTDSSWKSVSTPGQQAGEHDALPQLAAPALLQNPANRSRYDDAATNSAASASPEWDGSISYGFAAAPVAPSTTTSSSIAACMAQHGGFNATTAVEPLSMQQQQQQQLQTPGLTHIDSIGSASMVDVSQKEVTVREAQASCLVWLGAAYDLVAANAVAKGDVLRVAQLAGVCGAKATSSLIPLCHNIHISKVDVQLQLDPAARTVVVRALARTDGKTGVEMEALTAASVAALTVYDMCKASSKDMVVGQLQLDYKSGGRGGTYLRAGLRRANLLPSARPPL